MNYNNETTINLQNFVSVIIETIEAQYNYDSKVQIMDIADIYAKGYKVIARYLTQGKKPEYIINSSSFYYRNHEIYGFNSTDRKLESLIRLAANKCGINVVS